jgi:hypothetical protein
MIDKSYSSRRIHVKRNKIRSRVVTLDDFVRGAGNSRVPKAVCRWRLIAVVEAMQLPYRAEIRTGLTKLPASYFT